MNATSSVKVTPVDGVQLNWQERGLDFQNEGSDQIEMDLEFLAKGNFQRCQADFIRARLQEFWD